MSKQANPKMIGAFVVGAAALILIGLLVFGGGQFLTEKRGFVLFFKGSVAGLNIGAPVNLRGVRIGSVTNVVMRYDPKEEVVYIPVYIEIEPGRIETVGGGRGAEATADELIALGVRGRLSMQSFVTGQMAIEFDFLPDTPANLRGAEPDYPELPTVPSTFEELETGVSNLIDKLGKIPFDQLVAELITAVGTLNLALEDIRGFVGHVDTQVAPLSESLTATSDQARSTLEDAQARLGMEPGEALYSMRATLDVARTTIDRLDRQIDPLAEGAKSTFKAAVATLDQAEQTIRDANRLVATDSPVAVEIRSALREISEAAGAIRRFAEYLERNPNALITGKTGGRN